MPRSLGGRNDSERRHYGGWLDLYGMAALTVFLAVIVALGFLAHHCSKEWSPCVDPQRLRVR